MQRKVSKFHFFITSLLAQLSFVLYFQIGFASTTENIGTKQISYFNFNIILMIVVIVLILGAMVLRILTNKELQEREIVRREQARLAEESEEKVAQQLREQQDELIKGKREPITGKREYEQQQLPMVDLTRHTPKVQEQPRQPVRRQEQPQQSQPSQQDGIRHSKTSSGQTIETALRNAEKISQIQPIPDEDSDIVPSSASELKLTDTSKQVERQQSREQAKAQSEPSFLDKVIQEYESNTSQSGSLSATETEDEIVPGSGQSIRAGQQTMQESTEHLPEQPVTSSVGMDEEDPFLDLEPDNPEQFFDYQMSWQVSLLENMIQEAKDEVQEAERNFEIPVNPEAIQGQEEVEQIETEQEQAETEQEQAEAEQEQAEIVVEQAGEAVAAQSIQEAQQTFEQQAQQIAEQAKQMLDQAREAEKQEQSQVQETLSDSDLGSDLTAETQDGSMTTSILAGAKTAQDIVKAFQPRKRRKRKK